jgi:hypothetical protein
VALADLWGRLSVIDLVTDASGGNGGRRTLELRLKQSRLVAMMFKILVEMAKI